MSLDIKQGSVTANGIEFGYLEAGNGPLALLLHGFPDNAWTWESQLDALASAGYHAVAPFLRGYPPTEVPKEHFDTETVSRDCCALIEALGSDNAYVVGHDWGALATLNAASVCPDRVKRAVAIGAGHPRTAIEIFKIPSQLHYAFHVWLFQLEGFGEFALKENDHALIDYLWDHWSEQSVDQAHVKRVKETFSHDGVAEATLSYYRGLVRIPSEKPDYFALVTKNISVPTMVVYGAEDPAQVLSENESEFFSGEYRRELVPGAAHFVQREQPDALNALLLEWLSAPDRSVERASSA